VHPDQLLLCAYLSPTHATRMILCKREHAQQRTRCACRLGRARPCLAGSSGAGVSGASWSNAKYDAGRNALKGTRRLTYGTGTVMRALYAVPSSARAARQAGRPCGAVHNRVYG